MKPGLQSRQGHPKGATRDKRTVRSLDGPLNTRSRQQREPPPLRPRISPCASSLSSCCSWYRRYSLPAYLLVGLFGSTPCPTLSLMIAIQGHTSVTYPCCGEERIG